MDEKTAEELRERVDTLEAALEAIIDRGECTSYWADRDADEPRRDCTCEVCIAKRALKKVPSGYDWRYRGVMHQRIGYNPREARMIRAWADRVGDHELANILFGGDRNSFPTARDWYVATSVVQWLATNVGMSVLEGAGFAYNHYIKDDRMIEEACDVSAVLGTPNKPKHR